MSNIDKQALREEFQLMQDHYSDPADRERQVIYIAAEALLDEMEAAEKRIAETNQRNTELTAKIEPMDRRIAELEREPIATLDVQSGRAYGNKFALAYSSAAHKLPDDVYYLCVAAAGIGVKGE